MATIEVYTFIDNDDNVFGTFETQNVEEAKDYASRNLLAIVAEEYEYSDSSLVHDYRVMREPEEPT